MDPPKVVRKVKSNMTLASASPANSGRASPFHSIRVQDRAPPMSPSSSIASRPQYTVKRPPSAASSRALDSGPLRERNLFDRPASALAGGYPPVVHPYRPVSAMSSRSAQPATGTGAENTVVSVRVRPAQFGAPVEPWLYNGSEKTIQSNASAGNAHQEYVFDNVFTEDDTNATIYDACVKRLVAGVLDGYHGTVFAYGMTGTGKTYSMQGITSSPGIIPQAVHDVFELIAADETNRYAVRVSYLEIYNERIRDLLNADITDGEEIRIRDDPKRGIHAYPLTELAITSASEFLSIMKTGDLVRHSAATDFNAHSSRSHAVVQLVIESLPAALDLTLSRAPGVAKIRTLNMIDLAGSEKAASDAERRKEGSYINKSLLTLGTVIARLTSGHQSSSAHVPFRDSKLTRLLQHALSGFSLVSILATINTDVRYTMETTNTLKFASRAKFIPGRAKKAELFGGDVNLLVESLRAEVSSLRIQLLESQSLVSKLQTGPVSSNKGFRTLSESANGSNQGSLADIHEDESSPAFLRRRLDVLEADRASQNTYIQELQMEVLRLKNPPIAAAGPTSPSSVHSPRTPTAGNFSYPVNHAQRTSATQDLLSPSLKLSMEAEDVDQQNALADKALAQNILSRSQRSREQARDLSLKLDQLKKREDKRSIASRLGFSRPATGANGGQTGGEREGKENGGSPKLKSARPQHTVVSPNIRAPREGFI